MSFVGNVGSLQQEREPGNPGKIENYSGRLVELIDFM